MSNMIRAHLRPLIFCSFVAIGLLLVVGVGTGFAITRASWSAPFFSFGNTNYNTSETVLGASNVASLTCFVSRSSLAKS